jgi:hypothetical protein
MTCVAALLAVRYKKAAIAHFPSSSSFLKAIKSSHSFKPPTDTGVEKLCILNL